MSLSPAWASPRACPTGNRRSRGSVPINARKTGVSATSNPSICVLRVYRIRQEAERLAEDVVERKRYRRHRVGQRRRQHRFKAGDDGVNVVTKSEYEPNG